MLCKLTDFWNKSQSCLLVMNNFYRDLRDTNYHCFQNQMVLPFLYHLECKSLEIIHHVRTEIVCSSGRRGEGHQMTSYKHHTHFLCIWFYLKWDINLSAALSIYDGTIQGSYVSFTPTTTTGSMLDLSSYLKYTQMFTLLSEWIT